MKRERTPRTRLSAAGANAPEARPHSLAEGLALASQLIAEVLGGASLSAALVGIRERPTGVRAAAQDFSYKALRAYGRVNAIADRLIDKPLEDRRLYGLLLAALAELSSHPDKAHTVVHQAVEAASLIDRARARGLVNAVLRRYQREAPVLLESISATEEGRYCHPRWWVQRVRCEYPERYEDVLAQGNTHPPMTLRVNLQKIAVEAYLERLGQAGIDASPLGGEAIRLGRPQRVEALPGFAEGEVSVQDAGAQQAARLLDVHEGMRVLDACAAPGGKAAHVLERCRCDVLAIDSSAERVGRITENFKRLGLNAEAKRGDSLRPESYSDGRTFARILLDVPCTASGVVRRHPDIKWLRRETDIASFASLQQALLDALWRVLAPDGKLLYVTCSVFPEENRLQADAFLARTADAQPLRVDGIPGGQILPGPDTDGFYYALFQKRP